MIPCAKSRWFTAWFAAQANNRLRRTFGALHLAGREHLEGALQRGPVLAVSNHSAWWDPMVILVLTRRLILADSYAMMDADNLRRRPFLAKIGAFGVDRRMTNGGALATRYAERLLDRPGRLVWVFPQGQERPLYERPLRFFAGASRIAVGSPWTAVIPVALSYAFGPYESPSVYVAMGEPLPPAKIVELHQQAQVAAVEAQLDRVQAEQSRPGSEGFEVLRLRRPGRLGVMAERMLAGMARPFVPGLRAPKAAERKALAPVRSGSTPES
ncbi:MAG: lysophospholipid acyltransferase family protein [Myxococcota bacterium]